MTAGGGRDGRTRDGLTRRWGGTGWRRKRRGGDGVDSARNGSLHGAGAESTLT